MEACLYRDEQKKQYQQKSPCSNLPIPKKKSFGKTLKFCSGLKGVISNVTLLFTDTSSREFPMSSWLVN